METSTEIYEHGRWQVAISSENMPRRYNQWYLSDRIGITLFCAWLHSVLSLRAHVIKMISERVWLRVLQAFGLGQGGTSSGLDGEGNVNRSLTGCVEGGPRLSTGYFLGSITHHPSFVFSFL
jgi:hypothetical protein